MRLSFGLLLLFICKFNEGKDCIQSGACICTFDDGSGVVNLTQMGRRDGIPLVQDSFAVDNYAYSFNPCYPFTEGTCVKAAACQYDTSNNIYYNIGESLSVSLSFDGDSVKGKYISDDRARTSEVRFICDPNTDPPVSTAFGETSTLNYGFEIVSKYACPQSRPTPTPVESCYTNFGDFTRRCQYSFDGNEKSIKLLIIENWNGECQFPANEDVAVSLHRDNSSCTDVIDKCNPAQAFSVNGYVCKDVTDQRKFDSNVSNPVYS